MFAFCRQVQRVRGTTRGCLLNFVTAVGRRILSETQQRNVLASVGYLDIRPGARSERGPSERWWVCRTVDDVVVLGCGGVVVLDA